MDVVDGLWAVARLIDIRGVSHTSALMDLDDAIIGEFLYTAHVPCLDGTLIVGAAVALGPLGQFPEGGAWLSVTLEMILIHHWLVQIDALFGGRDFRGSLSNALDDRCLNSTPTGL